MDPRGRADLSIGIAMLALDLSSALGGDAGPCLCRLLLPLPPPLPSPLPLGPPHGKSGRGAEGSLRKGAGGLCFTYAPTGEPGRTHAAPRRPRPPIPMPPKERGGTTGPETDAVVI